MKRIEPSVLKQLLGGRSLQNLADQAKVNKQTVWRLLQGQAAATRDHTVEKIARALKVDPQVLTGEAPIPEVDEREAPTSWSQLNVRVSDAARNALGLVAKRYDVKRSHIIELAPFLFCWAAEASLRQRRDRIAKIEEAWEGARKLENEIQYLPVPNFIYSEQKIVAEQESIDRWDLFGAWLVDKADIDLDFTFDPDTENPFAMFLRNLVAGFGDVVTFEGWSRDWIPQYRVCPDEAAQLVGGDRDRAKEILDGLVALNDMPTEIRKPEMAKERAEWVRAKAEENRKKQINELL